MHVSPEWRVRIEQSVIKYIRGTPQDSHESYLQAVEGILDLAAHLTKLSVAACSTGFLVPVKDTNTSLRCGMFGDKREIHIFGIKE